MTEAEKVAERLEYARWFYGMDERCRDDHGITDEEWDALPAPVREKLIYIANAEGA